VVVAVGVIVADVPRITPTVRDELYCALATVSSSHGRADKTVDELAVKLEITEPVLGTLARCRPDHQDNFKATLAPIQRGEVVVSIHRSGAVINIELPLSAMIIRIVAAR